MVSCMKKILKYALIAEFNHLHLVFMINEAINLGFQPYGDLIVITATNPDTMLPCIQFIQVMVQYEN